jgi:hypothetical protein
MACNCGTYPEMFAPLCSDYLPLIKSLIRTEWHNYWRTSTTGNFYKNVQERIPSQPWYETEKISKLNVSMISRMRIGHCVVASHLARINVVPSPLCACETSDETLDHVFFECPLYERREFVDALKEECDTFPLNVLYLLSQNCIKIYNIMVKFLKLNNKKL